MTASTGQITVYVGTYTQGDSKGIYVSRLDRKTGTLSPPQLAAESVNPSFLAIHPSRRFVYAVGEISNFEGTKTGGVSAFTVNPHERAHIMKIIRATAPKLTDEQMSLLEHHLTRQDR